MRVSKRRFVYTAVITIILLLAATLLYTYFGNLKPIIVPSGDIKQSGADPTHTAPKSVKQPYEGSAVAVADAFTIRVPNGWTGSISTASSFTAVMFARPNQLSSLVYDAGAQPDIPTNGIEAWSGLTEHFFVLAPTPTQQFKPSDHQNVSSESFTFDDGTVGKKYDVVKYADEAQKWGGLQRDTEWQGRTYIYEKDGKRIEAHLAVYPSSDVSISFFETVAKSITTSKQDG